MKFQYNIVFDSVPFRTLYFTIIPLQGLVYVHMQIIKCYLESYSNKLPAAFEKEPISKHPKSFLPRRVFDLDRKII